MDRSMTGCDRPYLAEGLPLDNPQPSFHKGWGTHYLIPLYRATLGSNSKQPSFHFSSNYKHHNLYRCVVIVKFYMHTEKSLEDQGL
jgi:hypothetical protein